ncbi:unnamed protein product, partial [Oppiella nova]
MFVNHMNFMTSSAPESDDHLNKEWLNRLPIRPGMVQFSVNKPHTLSAPEASGRSKRRSGATRLMTELVQDVCPSVSDWVARSEALDP